MSASQAVMNIALSRIHQFELEWIVALQGLGDWEQWMTWISRLGWNALPYGVAFVYFCISRRTGARFYLLFSFNISLLHSLKMVFHSPRPYWLDARIQASSGAGNYGMPSGHVFGASITWPFLAKTINRPWAWLIALVVVFLVSVSRVYLGAHFFSDLVVAWGIAAVLLWLYHRLEPTLTAKLRRLGVFQQIGIGFCATAVLLMTGFGVDLFLDGVVDPPAWAESAANARSLTGLFESSGQFFGAACGVAMCSRWSPFEIPLAWSSRLMALAYALLNGWLVNELWTMIPTPQDHLLWLGWEFLRGAFPKCWIIFVVPWILLKMGFLRRASKDVDLSGDG